VATLVVMCLLHESCRCCSNGCRPELLRAKHFRVMPDTSMDPADTNSPSTAVLSRVDVAADLKDTPVCSSSPEAAHIGERDSMPVAMGSLAVTSGSPSKVHSTTRSSNYNLCALLVEAINSQTILRLSHWGLYKLISRVSDCAFRRVLQEALVVGAVQKHPNEGCHNVVSPDRLAFNIAAYSSPHTVFNLQQLLQSLERRILGRDVVSAAICVLLTASDCCTPFKNPECTQPFLFAEH